MNSDQKEQGKEESPLTGEKNGCVKFECLAWPVCARRRDAAKSGGMLVKCEWHSYLEEKMANRPPDHDLLKSVTTATIQGVFAAHANRLGASPCAIEAAKFVLDFMAKIERGRK